MSSPLAAVPSVYDTRCDGAGLLPTTQPWSKLYRVIRKYTSDVYATLPFPDPATNAAYDCHGKTVIISGSNSGIGKQAAVYFARAGAQVVMACRFTAAHEQPPEEARQDIVKLAGVKDAKVELWEIDCASLDSVANFGSRWRETGRTCDILVNNAGLASGRRIITDAGFELTHVINFLSHCLMTFYVLPTMIKSAAPRVINTCSIFHSDGNLDFADMDNEKHSPTGPSCVQFYCNTKLWLLMWSVELQERLSRSDDYRHVICHGIHPGFVGSNIWNNPESWALKKFKPLMDAAVRYLSVDPVQGSFAIINASLNPHLGLPTAAKKGAMSKPDIGESAKYGGKFINRNIVDIRRPEVDDPLCRSRLWQRVLEDVNVKLRGLASDLPDHLESIKQLGK